MGRGRKRAGRLIDKIAKWLLRFRIVSVPAKVVSNSWLAWSFVSRLDRVRVKRQRSRISREGLPKHVSIIMDGNRRFALSLSLGTEIGHVHGKEKLKEVMDWILDLGIPYLTVYALSTENLSSRDPDELESLFDLYVAGLNEISEDERIHSKGVRVRVVGRKEDLPERVNEAIINAEDRTSDYSNFTFTDEISSRLYDADIPDPDLVIRTSGEERVSNFLLWQIAYSELYFTDVHWPSFSKAVLYEAIETYQMRRRRYGG